MSAEDDLLALEERVLAAAAGDWIRSIDRIKILVAAEAPGVRKAVLALIAPEVDARALAGLAEAFGLGMEDALAIVRRGQGVGAGAVMVARVREELTFSGLPASAVEAVTGLTASAAEALEKTRLLMLAGVDETTYLAPLYESRNHVKRSIEFALNDASNAASEAVAESAGLPVVWIAERNACVHCLAYSGQYRRSGELFPGDLTFGAKPLSREGGLRRPPLHPHCRCRLEPLNAVQYATALQREARRSILRGWSLESESMSQRLGAAERLLESGFDDAPQSVLTFARRSIKKGAFPTRGPVAA